MASKSWKGFEYFVCKDFNGKRTPGSGAYIIAGTVGDMIHPRLYGEFKFRWTGFKYMWELLKLTREEAKKEGLVPAIFFRGTYRGIRLKRDMCPAVLVNIHDLVDVADEFRAEPQLFLDSNPQPSRITYSWNLLQETVMLARKEHCWEEKMEGDKMVRVELEERKTGMVCFKVPDNTHGYGVLVRSIDLVTVADERLKAMGVE